MLRSQRIEPPATAPPRRGSLIDPQGRVVDYLRLAVTDRCNLRCRYCMPAEGIAAAPRRDLLSLEELTRICRVFCELGVRKIRVTGGEPLLRKGLAAWLGKIARLPGSPEVLLTTNGVLLEPSLEALVQAGLRRVNLSLDSLRPSTWKAITRRGGHRGVVDVIDEILARGLGLKINVVVLSGINDGELLDFVELTRERPLTVRFIEPMPFSGTGGESFVPITGAEIRGRIGSKHELVPYPGEHAAVDRLYAIADHRGLIGIIEGFRRTFCGRCSRLRLSPRGELRTCLYGPPAADLGGIIRTGSSDDALKDAIRRAVGSRFVDGHAAAASHAGGGHSMARIGG